MSTQSLLRRALALSTLLCAACAAEAIDAPDKAAFRDAKADGDIPSERVCVALGAPPTCDVCRVAEWYDDGECDDFCVYLDRDCAREFEQDAIEWRCDTVHDAARECSGGDPIGAECLPDAGDGFAYEAAENCCSWRRDWCEALPEPDERFRPAIRWVRVPYRFLEIDAGDSGHHRIGGYAPHEFSASRFAGELRQYDRDVRGCEARDYSRSREGGVAMYEAFLAARDPHADESYPAGRILEAMRDADNAAVFASVPAEGSDDASCAYWSFYTFRPDGTVLHLDYDDRATDADLASATGPGGVRYLPDEDLAVVDRMQEYGHNGGSSIGFWDESALDYDTLTTHARVHAASRYGCVDRGISPDSDAALARFDAHVRSGFHMFDYYYSLEGIEDEFPRFGEDTALISAYVEDPTNRAVLSSEFMHEDRDYSEGCLIYDFYVLRDDGVAVRFSVNQTD